MFSFVIIFMFLLCCSAFFSGAETALFSLSAVQLKKIKNSAGVSGLKLANLLRNPRKVLVTILLGNELVNVAMSIIGAAVISRFIQAGVHRQTIVAVIVVTPLVLIFGEIVPKNIAFRSSRLLAPIVIWPLGLFYNIVKPLRVFLTMIADRVIKILGGSPEQSEPMIMEEEYRRLVDMGRQKGIIAVEEQELIHNVFDFADKVVADIMTPADKIFAISEEKPYEAVLEDIKAVQFSRVPFYKNDINDITGVLHVRDLFSFQRRRKPAENADIKAILHPPVFVAADTSLENLLKEFQITKTHMAFVKDVFQKTAGIVTMDDVLEELFGEIRS